MILKHKKLWENLYKEQEYAIDFTGQIILKDEFRTNKPYSWDYDKYDYDDNEKFIASQEVIKLRNKQPIFDYKNQKYIIVKNDDYSYSILSPSKLIDIESPINYDLFLSNLITNYQGKEYIVLSITYKKMNDKMNDIFLSFISTSLKELLNFEYIKLETNNVWKNKMFFLIDKTKSGIKKILKNSMIIKSLIQSFILRTNEKENQIWKYDEDINVGFHFNIFIYSTKTSSQNIFEENQKTFVDFVETFENRILLNQEAKNELENLGVLGNEFTKLYDYNENNIYSYDYVNNRFNAFYLKLKNRSK